MRSMNDAKAEEWCLAECGLIPNGPCKTVTYPAYVLYQQFDYPLLESLSLDFGGLPMV